MWEFKNIFFCVRFSAKLWYAAARGIVVKNQFLFFFFVYGNQLKEVDKVLRVVNFNQHCTHEHYFLTTKRDFLTSFTARKVPYQLCQAYMPTCFFMAQQKAICNCTGHLNRVYPEAKCRKWAPHSYPKQSPNTSFNAKSTESNAHKPSFQYLQIKKDVRNMATAASKLGEGTRKGTCPTPRPSIWLPCADTDRTLPW